MLQLSLEQTHIQPTATASGLVRNAATEEQLWAYLAQLTSALRAIHTVGLACRAGSLQPTKVRTRTARTSQHATVLALIETNFRS